MVDVKKSIRRGDHDRRRTPMRINVRFDSHRLLSPALVVVPLLPHISPPGRHPPPFQVQPHRRLYRMDDLIRGSVWTKEDHPCPLTQCVQANVIRCPISESSNPSPRPALSPATAPSCCPVGWLDLEPHSPLTSLPLRPTNAESPTVDPPPQHRSQSLGCTQASITGEASGARMFAHLVLLLNAYKASRFLNPEFSNPLLASAITSHSSASSSLLDGFRPSPTSPLRRSRCDLPKLNSVMILQASSSHSHPRRYAVRPPATVSPRPQRRSHSLGRTQAFPTPEIYHTIPETTTSPAAALPATVLPEI
ncbi:hypothetical protein NMY22_g7773 [Coprinellus aureogranulatus]|nr:hypothetical protein NMY22_g7773 [Coprinellus aureogranulatus]